MQSPTTRAPNVIAPARNPVTTGRKQAYGEEEKIRDALKRFVKRIKALGRRFPERGYGFHPSGHPKSPFGAILLYTRPSYSGVAFSVSGWMECSEARKLAHGFCEELQALKLLRYPKRVYAGRRKAVRAMTKQHKSRFLRKLGRKAASVIHTHLRSAPTAANVAAAGANGRPEGQLEGHGATGMATQQHNTNAAEVHENEEPRTATLTVMATDEQLPFCNYGRKGDGWKTWAIGPDGRCVCGNSCAEGRKLFSNYPPHLPFVDFRGKTFSGTNEMYTAVITTACSHSPAFKAMYESAEKEWKDKKELEVGRRRQHAMGEQQEALAINGGGEQQEALAINGDGMGDEGADDGTEPARRVHRQRALERRGCEGTAWDPCTKGYNREKLIAAFEQHNGGGAARGISQLVKLLGGSARDLVEALAKENLAFFRPTPGQLAEMTRLYHALREEGKASTSLGAFIADSIPGGWKGSRVVRILKEQNIWVKGCQGRRARVAIKAAAEELNNEESSLSEGDDGEETASGLSNQPSSSVEDDGACGNESDVASVDGDESGEERGNQSGYSPEAEAKVAQPSIGPSGAGQGAAEQVGAVRGAAGPSRAGQGAVEQVGAVRGAAGPSRAGQGAVEQGGAVRGAAGPSGSGQGAAERGEAEQDNRARCFDCLPVEEKARDVLGEAALGGQASVHLRVSVDRVLVSHSEGLQALQDLAGFDNFPWGACPCMGCTA
ncbi:hypothetical protein VOLCADRAFT_100151 [Volvox carteri f. nagariensis]|uniref:Uncharacterized protein n=1 Tax=Volvox carteri f. nagariensis TaxID=3068 RepID=D8UJJ2_VOLCA|nr:uncharacterized protein VOLCADRAFT_100151 [Volvox carteri f. nagariensis]EFJ40093.1 hypothetical protein VOLCADRAFT_100151 [Volvox carteri f. nagariensis]|eukprot:XP_002958842.1 hypothetical protein VOLCADRAFT_100151 [Volvox carteri f. nagariensis]